MTIAQLRFTIFVSIVLALPAGLMAAAEPQFVDFGKLAMILSPAVVGLALSLGLRDRMRGVRWSWIVGAAILTFFVTVGALAVAFAAGVASFRSTGVSPATVVISMGGPALTSVLEELGWAGGGYHLAVAALGRRLGVLVLGLVWAAWHLIPVVLHVGLFSYLEGAPPLMILAFVVSCLIYRELLTVLRERANTWMAAAAGHAIPNIFLAGLIASGVELSDRSGDWPLFPAPGGLAFPLFALGALFALIRTKNAPERIL